MSLELLALAFVIIAVAVLTMILLILVLRPPPKKQNSRRQPPPSHTGNYPPVHTPSIPPQLVAIQGPLEGKTFEFAPPSLRIGRYEDNHIALVGEQLVSGEHAVIYKDQGRYILVDQSVNGTWVNGQRIQQHFLRPGDHIQIWNSTFVFNPVGDSVRPPTPGGRPIATQPPRVGDTILGYQLTDKLGEGGMAVVYKAVTNIGQNVAIKVFLQDDPTLLKRFAEEERIGREVLRVHPNIVTIIPTRNDHQGWPFLVMEYVEGGSLRDEIHRFRQDFRLTRRVLQQVCDALSHAHNYNIIHRDIKPENILIDRNDNAKVADFGIAKVVGSVTITRDRKVIGTPEYLAPEQIKGKVEPASDIYAMGVVLYEILTGSVPFPREGDDLNASTEVMKHHLYTPPEDPLKHNPRIPRDLAQIALKALAKSPKDRFPSAAHLAKALGGNVSSISTGVRQRAAAYFEIKNSSGRKVIRLGELPFVVERQHIDENDQFLSRRHFEIDWRAGEYVIIDLSRNGTFVNGKRVAQPEPLTHHQEVQAGNHQLLFCIEDGSARR